MSTGYTELHDDTTRMGVNRVHLADLDALRLPIVLFDAQCIDPKPSVLLS